MGRHLNRNKEASQTRDCCVAKNATPRAARSGPSVGKERPPQDDNEIASTSSHQMDHGLKVERLRKQIHQMHLLHAITGCKQVDQVAR